MSEHRPDLGAPTRAGSYEPPGPSADPAGVDDDPAESGVAAAGAAPAVVAVIVAHDPGPWFEESLRSVAGQDYPSLDVLVLDAASEVDITPRVAAVAPQAYVRRLDTNAGYGSAANEVLHTVEGASFYLFCHDDIALAPDALRSLVEEAYRSNGGIVGPKLVEWDDPTRLVDVGLALDKTGVPAPLAERGELDQEQHDAVRDVFALPGGCLLVRADLFTAVGGFDDGIDFLGDDVDLCWRAQVAGARVIVAPAAVARHLEALGERRPDDRRRLQARHRLRSMLVCYGPWHLVRVLPQAVLLMILEVGYAIVAGHPSQARDVADAWAWNIARAGDIRRRRAALRKLRQVPDSEVRRLQVRGSARVSAFLRGQIGHGDDRLRSLIGSLRAFVVSVRRGERRASIATWAAVLLFLLIGSRVLLTKGPADFGDLPRFQHGPVRLFAEWFSGWRNAGLGSEAPAPTAFAILGAASVLFFGAVGLLRTFMVIGLLPVGAFGAWRLLRGAGSRPRLVCLVTYLVLPLPYNAIADGRWGGLLVWTAAPFIVARLGRTSGLPPFETGAADRPRTSMRRELLALVLIVAVVAAFVPSVIVLAPLMALAVALGAWLSGSPAGAMRILIVGVGAAVGAAVLQIPWTFDFLLPGRQWAAFVGVKTAGPGISLSSALRFETGPIGAGWLGWAYLAAAALPLLVGRAWRFSWALRGWMLALLGWALAWAGGRSGFPLALPPPDVLLVPAALGMAMAAGLGLASFDQDLPGYRFGWRQVASVVAALGVAVAVVPVAGAVVDGRWQAPSAGFDTAVGFLNADHASAGPYRVLWIGDPAVLPMGSWRLQDGVAYATTESGTATIEDRWAGSSDGPTQLVAGAMSFASKRETSRLGRLLAPMGIRYVVVAEASDPFAKHRQAIPTALVDALAGQLDLSPVDVPSSQMLVFRNNAWMPTRAALPTGTLTATSGDYYAVAGASDLHGAKLALPSEKGYTTARGPVASGTDVYLGSSSSTRWHLQVDGTDMPRRKAFGWANVFAVSSAGTATLRYRTSPARWAMLVVEALLWGWCVLFQRRAARALKAEVEPVAAA